MTRRNLTVAVLSLLIVGATEVSGSASQSRRYRFRNVTVKVGISPERTINFGSLWADYDKDGDPDLLVNRHWRRPWFYGHISNGYRRLREDFVYKSRVDRHGCAWGEANGDGRPDLYCTVGAQHGMGQGPNQLFLQTRRGRFAERAGRFRVRDRFGRGRVAHWLDYDGDRDLDLFVLNGKRSGHLNVLFRNDRGRFRRVDAGIAESLPDVWPHSAWSDWDADHDPDLLILRDGGDRPVAYENVGGSFRQVRLSGVTQHPWHSASFGDYDGDGWPDLVLVSERSAVIAHNEQGVFKEVRRLPLSTGRMGAWLDLENDGDLDLFLVQGAPRGSVDQDGPNRPDYLVVTNDNESFSKVRGRTFRGPRRGNGEAVTVTDHNRDGRMDVFVTNGHNPSKWTGRSTLLENQSRTRNWAALRLRGRRWNPFGYGATIRLRNSRLDYQRQMTDSVSYRGQSEPGYVHLGLKGTTRARVVVRWPGGKRDCLRVLRSSIKTLRAGSRPCG